MTIAIDPIRLREESRFAMVSRKNYLLLVLSRKEKHYNLTG